MQWFTILLVGIAANLDNLGISLSYGLKSNRIPFSSNLLIAFISMIGAYISIITGGFLSNYLPQFIANFIGSALIICLGFYFMLTPSTPVLDHSSRKTISDNAKLTNSIKIKAIGLKESLFLGFILALNCLTIGFGAGITGVSALPTSISIGFFSVISIFIGIKIGNRIGDSLFGNYANKIAGLLLILIGVIEMFI